MKRKFLLLGFILSTVVVYAENDLVLLAKKGNVYHPQRSIPVEVDFSCSKLKVSFKEDFKAFIVIKGAEGIVYQCAVDGDPSLFLDIDFAKYKEGDYVISFYDMNGNEITGSFTKEDSLF